MPRTLKPGATGKYPDGSLGRDDEGELNIAVTRDRYNNVRLEFGKPVAWMAMPRAHDNRHKQSLG